ncbi:MAG: ABC transporter substrate-binding protein [Meiothermus sp.]|nr:ABC transporter substrate-binding protein [Meiothermus sp.]
MCGTVGTQFELCRTAAGEWAQRTGNRVEVIQAVPGSNDRLAFYQQQLAAGSSDIDIYQIENIWPSLLADFFVDMKEYVPAAALREFFPTMIENHTVGNKLVAIPWYGDAGLLYYRTDLLQKYGFRAPPRTWAELEQMAKAIQDGERRSNPNFWGFVWQGAAYEGLTCDALEWIVSFGGGTIIDSRGNVTVNNAQAAAALRMAASWVGTISPRGVTSYREEDSRGVWQAGNAAFMRNWPYAFALGNSADSPIRGKFDVTVLPRGTGPNAANAATFGGHSLAVSRFSKNPRVAADLAIYMTSVQVQSQRAVLGYNPTRPSVYKDQAVLRAAPFVGKMDDVMSSATVRPTTITGAKYPRVSEAFWNAVHSVLTGQARAEDALAQLETTLNRIKGNGW